MRPRLTVRNALFVMSGLGLLTKGLRGIGALCFLRGQHDPRRHHLGGYRCSVCRLAGADTDDFGGPHFGSAYVPPVRRVYAREHGDFTRTEHFEPGSRGIH